MAELETGVVTETNEQTETDVETQDVADAGATESAEISRLRAELAKQKATIDKVTKEAGDYKKALRAKQSAEEAAAEDARLHQEEIEKELGFDITR